MKNKNKPEIRFPEYNQDWEERNLNKLVTPVIREVPKPDKPYERISVRSHAKGTFHQKVEDPKTVSMDKLYVVKENDLIVNITFAWEHAIAIARKEDDGLFVSHRFPTFVIDKSDINFIHYSVTQENFRRKMELISPGGAGRNRVLNKNDFVNLKLNVPIQIEEQTKIGNFFKQLDETISLHQKELTILKQTKQGFFQKMFPKEGKHLPEVRFPEFTGEWEQLKLEEIANYRRGSFPQPYGNKEWYDDENGMPFVQVVDVGENLKLADNTKQKISKLAQPKSVFVEEGKVIITLQGSIGRVAITQYSSYVDRTLLIFENYKVPINKYYFAYVIQQLFEREKQMAPGGTIKTITKEALSDFLIYLPKVEEQTKIGNLFKKIDDTIDLHQRELEALKETKKAFLQKMFV